MLHTPALGQTGFMSTASLTSVWEEPPMQAPQRPAYKVTYPPGFRMRNTGRLMTVAGAGLLIGGIVVFDQADKTVQTVQTSTGTYDQVDPQVALAVLMVFNGVGLTVPGIILWTRGAKKFNHYLEQQMELSFRGDGLSLQFKF